MTAFRKMIVPILAAAALVGITGSASAVDNFQMTPNAGIPGHNQETHPNVSVQSCLALCNQRSWCKSADYERAAGTCFLQPVNATQQSLRQNYPGNPYDHYSKQEMAVRLPTGSPSAESTCYQAVMSKGLQIGRGSVPWTDANARRLCRDTPTAKHTIDCYKEANELGASFDEAMSWCEYSFSACAHAQYDRSRNWKAALRQCHWGNRPAVDATVAELSLACFSTAMGAALDQSQAFRLCEARGTIKLPATCYKKLRPHVADTDLAVELCRNVLHPDITLECFTAGKRNYPNPLSRGQVETIIEVCRMQDNQLDGITQQAHTFAMGLRDSCVRRRALNLQTGALNLAGGWSACAGQRLY